MSPRLQVEPVPGEPTRFFVSSESRDLRHLVDLDYRESPEDKPKAVCGCEQVFAKGKTTCKHLEAVVEYLQEMKAS